jgi:hypothetical protein
MEIFALLEQVLVFCKPCVDWIDDSCDRLWQNPGRDLVVQAPPNIKPIALALLTYGWLYYTYGFISSICNHILRFFGSRLEFTHEKGVGHGLYHVWAYTRLPLHLTWALIWVSYNVRGTKPELTKLIPLSSHKFAESLGASNLIHDHFSGYPNLGNCATLGPFSFEKRCL